MKDGKDAKRKEGRGIELYKPFCLTITTNTQNREFALKSSVFLNMSIFSMSDPPDETCTICYNILDANRWFGDTSL
jgi:hypothetical protein